MATWHEMALQNREAAKDLLLRKQFRSSISRSYYAAYCAVTGLLAGSITFGYGGNNPTHNELPQLALNNLGNIEKYKRRKIQTALIDLFAARTDADYVPTATVGNREAVRAVIQMNNVFRLLEVDDE